MADVTLLTESPPFAAVVLSMGNFMEATIFQINYLRSE